MLRCCWRDNSGSEELRRVSAATLDEGGRATTDARGVGTGGGKGPSQATQRPGDAVRYDERRLRSARRVRIDASYGWGICRASLGG